MLKSNLSLSLNYNLSILATESFLKPEISSFLYFQTGLVEEFRILDAEEYISSYDFKDPQIVPIEYIYLKFLDQMSFSKNSLNIPISVFITFDKRQCTEYCNKSGRSYSSIKIGGVSKIYYILFSIDEIYDFIYSKEIGYTEEDSPGCYDSVSRNYSNKDQLQADKVVLENKYIKGYLDNHNLIKGLSFVSVSDEDGYPVYHRDFPDIVDIDVGTVLELEVNNAYTLGKVISYEQSDASEIEGVIQSFTGTLSKINSIGFITTSTEGMSPIFVPPKLAKNFDDSKFIKVICLARNKKPLESNQYKWSALRVKNRNKTLIANLFLRNFYT